MGAADGLMDELSGNCPMEVMHLEVGLLSPTLAPSLGQTHEVAVVMSSVVMHIIEHAHFPGADT